MEKEKRILLKEMLQELSEEQKNFQDKIDKNLCRIAEIDAFLNSIYEKEDSDFKVFSPRNVENVYREQIEKGKQEKYSIENENQYQYRQINRLTHYIEIINAVLSEEDTVETVSIENSVMNLKVLDLQEKDRQRIARDLHDTSLQNLAHLIHMIELSSLYIDKDPIQAKLELESVNKNLKSIITDIRDTIFDLRPMSFDDLGFKEMLEDFVKKLRQDFKMEIEFHVDEIPTKNEILLLTLYRVIRECCLNALKHSKCDYLLLQIHYDSKNIEIEVKDNGIGFDVEHVYASLKNHYGLKIMKERIELIGGKFKIISAENEGTDIRIHVPIMNEEV